MTKTRITKLTQSAVFLALGIVLPMLTGQLPQIGKVLLPMHIPVLLCGFLCGWKYGLCVGGILPLIRTVCFGVPVFYPTALAVAMELATYGLITGILFEKQKTQNLLRIYIILVSSMLLGRVVRGVAEMLLLGLRNEDFSWKLYITATVASALPGIILQLILIPTIVIRGVKREL